MITFLVKLPEMWVLVAIDASRLDRLVQDWSVFRPGKMALLATDFQMFSR